MFEVYSWLSCAHCSEVYACAHYSCWLIGIMVCIHEFMGHWNICYSDLPNYDAINTVCTDCGALTDCYVCYLPQGLYIMLTTFLGTCYIQFQALPVYSKPA